jgi:CDP-diacylglycerol pyrophosphatase
MSKKMECAAGYLRVNELMLRMIEAVEEGNKGELIRLAKHFSEDSEDFIGVLLTVAGVEDDDYVVLESDDELIKDASSAEAIKAAKVKDKP